jgi:hypothetical protein
MRLLVCGRKLRLEERREVEMLAHEVESAHFALRPGSCEAAHGTASPPWAKLCRPACGAGAKTGRPRFTASVYHKRRAFRMGTVGNGK